MCEEQGQLPGFRGGPEGRPTTVSGLVPEGPPPRARMTFRLNSPAHETPAALWTAAQQAPLSMDLQARLLECWSGLPCAPPGDLPDPGIEPASPALEADSFTTEPPEKPG